MCVRSVFPSGPVLGSAHSAAGCPTLFAGFIATTTESDFSGPFIIGYGSSPSRCGPARYCGWSGPRSPGSRAKSVRACQVLRPRRVARALALTRSDMWPSATQTASAPGNSFLSRLNGWPARTPTDASPPSSRMTAHGSGPMWFATPSSQWTCTTYSLPVSRRTCVKTPPLRKFGGRLTFGMVEKVAPNAIWRFDISSHATRSAFSHSLGRSRAYANVVYLAGQRRMQLLCDDAEIHETAQPSNRAFEAESFPISSSRVRKSACRRLESYDCFRELRSASRSAPPP